MQKRMAFSSSGDSTTVLLYITTIHSKCTTNISGSLWEMAGLGKSISCMKTAQEKDPHSTYYYHNFLLYMGSFQITFFSFDFAL